MPTYDYDCPKCGTFEMFQSITAEPLKKCPHCGGRKVKRLIGTGGGLIFKGSGFYITDYRSEEYKQKAKADKETPVSSTKDDSSSKSSDKKESKSESAPVKKTGEQAA